MRLIENLTDKVVNILKVDPNNLPDLRAGFRLEDVDANIGDILVDGVWVEDVAKKQADQLAEDAARIARIKQEFDNQNSVNKVLLKISFLQENRIRVLEGNPEITSDQFRAWVDGQID